MRKVKCMCSLGCRLLVAVALWGASSSVWAVEKISQKFSFQGVVTDVPDGAYSVDLTVTGGNSTRTFPLTGVQFTNGVFTVMLDGASDANVNPSLFYTSTGTGDIRVNIVVHLAGGDETFYGIPISSVANAWVASRAGSAAMADSAVNTIAVAGVTVHIPDPNAITDGQILKYNATAKKFVLGADDNAGAGISQGNGAGQIPSLNGSAKWDTTLLDTGVTNGKLLLVGSGDWIPDSVISSNIARTSGVATLTAGFISDSVISSNIARTANVATLSSGKIADGVIPTNIPRMVSGKIVAGDLPTITATELGNDVVNGAKIYDGSVDTPDLANASVTTVKIAGDAVTNGKIAAGTINWDKLNLAGVTANGAILAFKDGTQLQWSQPSPAPLTAKGDLYVHDGTSATRLPAYSGTNHYVLAIDGSSATGLAWMNPDDIGGHAGENNGNSNDTSRIQKIMSGSRDSNGYNFMTAAGDALTLDATPVPVVVSIANGSNPVVGVTLAADLTLNSISDGIHYVYLDVTDSSGSNPTLNYTSIVPMYESSCPTSGVTTGAHCFDYGTRRMRFWTGSSWQDKYRIFLGWVAVSAGTIDAVGIYMDSPLQYSSGGGRLYVSSEQFWAIPFNVNSLLIEAWGGGGGGAGPCYTGSNNASGAGGGSGAYGRYLISGWRGGQVLKLKPGMGGMGGAGDNSSCTSPSIAGGDAQDTEIATATAAYVLAPGGKGGGKDAMGTIDSAAKTTQGVGGRTFTSPASFSGFAQVIMQSKGVDGGWGSTMYTNNNGGTGGTHRLGGDGGVAGDYATPTAPGAGQLGGGGGGGYGATGNSANGAPGAAGALLISY